MGFISGIKKSEFGKNVAVLMTGNGISQLFVILIAPVLARLFTPAEIGVYAFLLSIVNVFTVISSGRYEQAIVISKNDKEAINVFSLGFLLLSSISILMLLLVFVLRISGFVFFDGNINEDWAYTIPFFNFLFSVYLLFRYYSIRIKKFKSVSASMPVESFVKGGLSIALGWLFCGAWGLVVAGFIGKFLSVLTIFKGVLNHIKNNFKFVSLSEVKQLAKIHYKFPAFDAPNALVYSFGQQGVIMFLTKLFNESIAGVYSYTNRILLTPIRFFAGSYAQVMYQKLSEIRNKEDDYYFKLIAKSTNQIFYILVIPFIIFVYTAKYYIPFVFGEDWIDLYRYMYALAPYSFMVLISPAFTNVFKIDNKQDVGLVLKIIFVALRIGAIVMGSILGWDIMFTLLVFSLVSVITMLLNYFVYYFIFKKPMPHSIYSYILLSFAAYFIMFKYLIY